MIMDHWGLIVKSGQQAGKINIEASAAGLRGGNLRIDVK